MRRYKVNYTRSGFDERQKGPFDTFEEARQWVRKNTSGWWTISNYYGSGTSLDSEGKPKEAKAG